MTTQTIETQTIEVRIDEETKERVLTLPELIEIGAVLTISSNEENETATKFLNKIKGVSSFLEEKRKEIKAPVIEAGNMIDDFFKGPLSELKRVEDTLKSASKTFLLEAMKIQQEAERKAYEEAQKEERRKREALQAQAARAEAAGKLDKAQNLIEKSEMVHIPVVVPVAHVKAAKGSSLRSTWKARVVNFSKIPTSYYLNDPKIRDAVQSVMNNLAKATKGGIRVDGVEFYEDYSLSASKG